MALRRRTSVQAGRRRRGRTNLEYDDKMNTLGRRVSSVLRKVYATLHDEKKINCQLIGLSYNSVNGMLLLLLHVDHKPHRNINTLVLYALVYDNRI
jgi:hypothetical protein